MRTRSLLVLLGLGLMVFGCAEDASPPLSPSGVDMVTTPDVAVPAWAFTQQAGWSVDLSAEELDQAGLAAGGQPGKPLLGFTRTVVSGDIVHYSAVITTGPGPYDRIGIHRVVREPVSHKPVRTKDALFLLHGDLKRFETMFIPGGFSPELADDFGIAVYLAANGVDVWGIDQAWNFVPREETDFSFFEDWGIQKEVDHLQYAMGVARTVRLLTGNGLDKMLLLGYSSGSATGYAYLNQETRIPYGHRQVKGFISADFGVRSDDPDWLAQGETSLELYGGLYDSGEYADPIYVFQDVAMLARTDPSGASPFVPGFTNMQVALFYAGGPIWSPSMAHFHAPVVEDGFPVDLQWLTVGQWLDFITATCNYEPTLFETDYSRMMAGQATPYIDNLGDITVPVLDIGGAGGIAPYTAATVSHLGSADVTQIYVATGAGDRSLEYGHIDIFTGRNSPTLVWDPILQWVQDHSKKSRR